MKGAVLGLLLGVVIFSGCEKVESNPSYNVQGVIQRIVPLKDYPAAFMIAHGAIDDFRNQEGRVVGMDAMAMNFTLAPDLSADGFATGDEVEFTFRVNWTSAPRLLITEIKKK